MIVTIIVAKLLITTLDIEGIINFKIFSKNTMNNAIIIKSNAIKAIVLIIGLSKILSIYLPILSTYRNIYFLYLYNYF